jgi:hydrogenase maturation factor
LPKYRVVRKFQFSVSREVDAADSVQAQEALTDKEEFLQQMWRTINVIATHVVELSDKKQARRDREKLLRHLERLYTTDAEFRAKVDEQLKEVIDDAART